MSVSAKLAKSANSKYVKKTYRTHSPAAIHRWQKYFKPNTPRVNKKGPKSAPEQLDLFD